MKRLFFFFVGMIPFLEVGAQPIGGFDLDTMFCVTIHCYQNGRNVPPDTYTLLMSSQDDCRVELSNYDTLIESLKNGDCLIRDFTFSLFEMVKSAFPDSSSSFLKKAYDNSILNWMLYNSSTSNSCEFYTETNDYLVVSVAKVIAVTKHNANGFHIAIGLIKDIVPMLLNDTCVNDDGLVLSKNCFFEI